MGNMKRADKKNNCTDKWWDNNMINDWLAVKSNVSSLPDRQYMLQQCDLIANIIVSTFVVFQKTSVILKIHQR